MTSTPPGDGDLLSDGGPLAVLRRIAATRTPEPGERCEMCAESIGAAHQHVVNLHSRGLMCTCRACYLLFSDQQANLRYRAVPDRYLSFADFQLDRSQWNELQIPVGLAFLFANSMLERTVAFYPGPAGATESELPLEAWQAIAVANPRLAVLQPDVEALLVRAPRPDVAADCHLVPIDACYELVGLLRRSWRGFDGGQEARQLLESFFADVTARSRPAPAPPVLLAPTLPSAPTALPSAPPAPPPSPPSPAVGARYE